MTIYVDNMRAAHGRKVMCHMVADTDEELHAMAARIGVERCWHQSPPLHESHYDISARKRELAVLLGAVETTMRELAAMCARRRHTGTLGTPQGALRWHRDHAFAQRRREAARAVECAQ